MMDRIKITTSYRNVNDVAIKPLHFSRLTNISALVMMSRPARGNLEIAWRSARQVSINVLIFGIKAHQINVLLPWMRVTEAIDVPKIDRQLKKRIADALVERDDAVVIGQEIACIDELMISQSVFRTRT